MLQFSNQFTCSFFRPLLATVWVWLAIEVLPIDQMLACIYSFLSPKIQQTYLWKPYILSDKWTLLRFSVSVPACLYVCKHVCLVIYLLGTFWSTVASINSNWSAYRISNAYNTHSCTQWMTPKRFQYLQQLNEKMFFADDIITWYFEIGSIMGRMMMMIYSLYTRKIQYFSIIVSFFA